MLDEFKIFLGTSLFMTDKREQIEYTDSKKYSLKQIIWDKKYRYSINIKDKNAKLLINTSE